MLTKLEVGKKSAFIYRLPPCLKMDAWTEGLGEALARGL